MPSKKYQNPFLECFRCYEVPADRLRRLQGITDLSSVSSRQDLNNGHNGNEHTLGGLNISRRGLVNATVSNDAHKNPIDKTAVEVTKDHFENSTNVRSSLPVHVERSPGTRNHESHIPLSEKGMLNSFVPKANILNVLGDEVKQLLKQLPAESKMSRSEFSHRVPQNSLPKSSFTNSSQIFSSNPQVSTEASSGTILVDPQIFRGTPAAFSKDSTPHDLKTSFSLETFISDQHRSSSGSQIATQAIFTSVKSLLGIQLFTATSPQSAFQQNLHSEVLSEGYHLVNWALKLGVPLPVIQTLIPALFHVQETHVLGRSFWQGLFVLYGIFAKVPYLNFSNLSWPMLKGIMLTENPEMLKSYHSPLLDELGALLSTSRKRLRKEAKKRISYLDKVSRKDSYLAEADTQEKEEDIENMLDVWPKKETDSSSTSFYYM